MVKAANGHELPAMTVFAMTLHYFRNHALRELTDATGMKVLADDVRWVITVPAIWRQKAKQFMREAAYQVRFLIVCNGFALWIINVTGWNWICEQSGTPAVGIGARGRLDQLPKIEDEPAGSGKTKILVFRLQGCGQPLSQF